MKMQSVRRIYIFRNVRSLPSSSFGHKSRLHSGHLSIHNDIRYEHPQQSIKSNIVCTQQYKCSAGIADLSTRRCNCFVEYDKDVLLLTDKLNNKALEPIDVLFRPNELVFAILGKPYLVFVVVVVIFTFPLILIFLNILPYLILSSVELMHLVL